MNLNKVKNTFVILLSIYSFGMSVYSGYTADNNIPNKDSSGLFITSFIICIISCLIYLGNFLNMILSIYYYKDDNTNKEFTGFAFTGLISIYWLVLHFNYNVSDKYDEYALVKTIEFFIEIGILIIFVLVVLPFIVFTTKKRIDNLKIDNTKHPKKTKIRTTYL